MHVNAEVRSAKMHDEGRKVLLKTRDTNQ
jgi:hypothetical protein